MFRKINIGSEFTSDMIPQRSDWVKMEDLNMISSPWMYTGRVWTGVDLSKDCTRVVAQEENVVCRCPLSLRDLNNECL